MLAALITTAAFIPSVQTMIAQRVLDRHPELRASLGSLAAGTGELSVRDLALVVDGAILALPSAQAQLPVTAALWNRTVHIRRLAAKGWTLDVSGLPPTPAVSSSKPSASPPASKLASPPAGDPVRATLFVIHRLLTTARLPDNVTVDELDLEGEVLIPAGRGRDPIGVHTIVRGGGLGADGEGSFTIDVTVPPTETTVAFAPLHATGRLTLAIDTARRPGRVALDINLAAKRGAWPDGLHVIMHWSAAVGSREETCTTEFRRGDRRIVNLTARMAAATHQLTGTWEISASDSDLVALAAPHALPGLAIAGRGAFDADGVFTRVHATGLIAATVSRLDAVSPALAHIGAASLTAEFDATQRDTLLRFDRLDLALAGDQPVATAHARQAFAVDETSGEVRPTEPRADWLDLALHGVPLAWCAPTGGTFAVSGSGVTGDLAVRGDGARFVAQTKAPLVATDLAVHRNGTALATDLACAVPLVAVFGRGGWSVKSSPLSVVRDGRQLAQFAITASRADDAKPVKVEATWTANLEELRTQTPLGERGFFVGHTASGNFSILTRDATNVESTLVVSGLDRARALTASFHLNTDPRGRFTFFAPFKLALGRETSEFTAEGSGAHAAGTRTTINLTGDQVVLDHLARLAAPLSAAGIISLPHHPLATISAPTIVKGARDTAPFWGDTNARVSFDFGRLIAWGHPFKEVGGTLFVDAAKVSLEGGRGVFHQDRRVRAQGTLTFDAKGESPYQLKGSAAVDEIDAALLLGATPPGREPLLHGRFAVAATLTSEGLNLQNLAWNAEEEFRLTSIGGGSTRLLETNIATALTEAPTPVSDAVGAVGSVFGKLLGAKSNILQAEKNPVGKITDAVLNFTYATKEFRYDQFAITAVRSWDRAIRLTQLDLTAASEHLSGTGQIDFAPDRAVAARPLNLDLRLGLRGAPATFLTEAGLLPADEDAQGYRWLAQPLHFGGTLEQIDRTGWRDQLVRAALPAAPAAKSERAPAPPPPRN